MDATEDMLIPWSRVIFRKLIVAQLAKKFRAFYGTRSFITVFQGDRHWSQSWARWIQSTQPHTRPEVLQMGSSLQIFRPKFCVISRLFHACYILVHLITIIILHALGHSLYRSHFWFHLFQGRPTVRRPLDCYCTICLGIFSSGLRSKCVFQFSL
jgi:hypothetical protein